MPGARCTHSLTCELKKARKLQSPQVRRNNPTFPAQWRYGLFRTLPGVRDVLVTVARSHRLRAWHQPGDARTTRLCRPQAVSFVN